MVEPKLSLTFVLPGSTMISQQVAENKPKKFMEEHKIVLKGYKSKKDKGPVIINFMTRKSIPAKQVLRMSKEAYEQIIKKPISPKYSKFISATKGNKPKRLWDTLSEDVKIKKYCELIAQDLGAISFTYTIFED